MQSSFPPERRAISPGRATLARWKGQRFRISLFVAICLICCGAAGAYTFHSVRHSESARQAIARSDSSDLAGQLASIASQPHLLFLQSDGSFFRQIAVTPLGGDGQTLVSSRLCQRVYYRTGRGLCLGKDYQGGAFIFDSNLNVLHEIDIDGVPSRVRISPDGRFGAMTVFVAGHSYSDIGFSTRTAIVDMESGAFVISNLEDLAVTKDGRRFESQDFNFWGVTFAADSNRFYATLGSGGKTYLIQGDVSQRQAQTLKENVECPSLSPDGARLVFKKRFTRSPLTIDWQLYVLDLQSLTERPLVETRSVDDQVEWLDDAHVLYYLHDEGPPSTIRPDVWVAPVDDDSPPRQLWTRAFSPSVVR